MSQVARDLPLEAVRCAVVQDSSHHRQATLRLKNKLRVRNILLMLQDRVSSVSVTWSIVLVCCTMSKRQNYTEHNVVPSTLTTDIRWFLRHKKAALS